MTSNRAAMSSGAAESAPPSAPTPSRLGATTPSQPTGFPSNIDTTSTIAQGSFTGKNNNSSSPTTVTTSTAEAVEPDTPGVTDHARAAARMAELAAEENQDVAMGDQDAEEDHDVEMDDPDVEEIPRDHDGPMMPVTPNQGVVSTISISINSARRMIKTTRRAGGETPTRSSLNRRRGALNAQRVTLRRSPRLATPATSFERCFNSLPAELRLTVWEFAAADASTGRCVYVRNMSSINLPIEDRIMNSLPALFHSCSDARKAIMKLHVAMFSRYSTATPVLTAASVELGSHIAPDPGPLSSGCFPDIAWPESIDDPSLPTELQNQMTGLQYTYRSQQPVNLELDIVMLEPCCNGCRGYHCARRQFPLSERVLVRRLAVQTEPPTLIPGATPCWLSISLAWRNVETLYLVVNYPELVGPPPDEAVTVYTPPSGNSRLPRALVRDPDTCGASDAHHAALLRRFADWKKEDGLRGGKDKKLVNIEFVSLRKRNPHGVGYKRSDAADGDRDLDAVDVLVG